MARDSFMPAWLPPIMRRYVNPVQRLWAPYLPPWALIVHRGRRTGAEHRSPVLAWRAGGELYVALFYGPRAQWVRNVRAAGGADAIRHGRRLRLADVRIVDDPGGAPWPVRRLARRMPILVAAVVPGQRE
jgi:deazaflavin-dependent oxidoreductase (nitroreductase family)